MNPGDAKKESRDSSNGQPDDAQKKYPSTAPSNNGDAPDRGREPHPVRVSREEAEKNIPSDPDPDDPASP